MDTFQFQFEDKKYSASLPTMVDFRPIKLPDGTFLKVTSWNKAIPPIPCRFERTEASEAFIAATEEVK